MTELVSIFQTIGVWGLIAVVILFVFYERNKTKNEIKKSQSDNQNNIDQKRADNQNIVDLQELIQNNSQQTLNVFKDFAETMIKKTNNGAIHTVEEEKRAVKMNEYIDNALQCLLEKTQAHRTFLVSYHNGERSIDGVGFQKMSCRNERTVPWVSPMITESQNLQRSMLSSIYKSLITQDAYFITDIEEMREKDPVAYAFFTKQGVRSLFLHSIKRDDGLVTGFIGLVYVNDFNFDLDCIEKYLEKKALKITGAMLGEIKKEEDE